MSENNEDAEIVKLEKNSLSLPALPANVMPAIAKLTSYLGVPRDVLASDEEIQHAWDELPRELKEIPIEFRGELIARMCVAVSTGLFDGAMNYIWNATIINLRDKIRNFSLSVVAQILQKDFEENHLLELQDNQLLELCHKLNLVNKDGFFFLDQCRDIRNNFSAAHPTIGKINDREFITFLNRCIKYGLANISSPRGVDISSFITAIKGPLFSEGQRNVWVGRLKETYDAQRQMLIGTIYGIYCDPNSSEPSRLNCLEICQSLKDIFTSATKSDLINKHSEYSAKGDEKRHKASQIFFEKLNIVGLLNETEKHYIFSKAIENLWNSHLGMNNFYNEPPFANRLLELSKQQEVPETAKEDFVVVVVCCFIGNGYGFSWGAAPYYREMIEAFSPREILMMIKFASSGENELHRRLGASSECKSRFFDVLNFINPKSVPDKVRPEYEHFLKKSS